MAFSFWLLFFSAIPLKSPQVPTSANSVLTTDRIPKYTVPVVWLFLFKFVRAGQLKYCLVILTGVCTKMWTRYQNGWICFRILFSWFTCAMNLVDPLFLSVLSWIQCYGSEMMIHGQLAERHYAEQHNPERHRSECDIMSNQGWGSDPHSFYLLDPDPGGKIFQF